MVIEYGMSEKIGPVSFSPDGFRSMSGRPLFPGERPDISEDTARMVDEEVTRLLNEAHDRARDILEKDRSLLDKLSTVLIEREVIEGKELRLYVDGEMPIPSKEELEREKEEDKRETEEIPPEPKIMAAPPETAPLPAGPD